MSKVARSPLAFVLAVVLCAGKAWAQPTLPAPPPSLETLDLEQLMDIEVVVAASKRVQQTRDAPSFVSVVTAAGRTGTARSPTS